MRWMPKVFRPLFPVVIYGLVFLAAGCNPGQVGPESKAQPADQGLHRFVVLDPGHFHAALVFKRAGYGGVSDEVGVYAPVGDDFVDHMARVVPFNTRSEDPAPWRYRIYLGPDYQEKALAGGAADVAVLSGRNSPKMDRIAACVRAGFNVLADKPWVIEPSKLALLDSVLAEADSKHLVAYDIMTERYEITSILQRLLVNDREVFGQITEGTPEDPAVVKKSVHHLYKLVAGVPNKRPWWFFDTGIQGEGLVDVTTHLVDIVFWILYPERAIDYTKDIKVLSARHWSTVLDRDQFAKVTGMPDFPSQLKLDNQGNLPYYCNGQFSFQVNQVNVNIQVEWNFQAPEGAWDTHYSIIKGSQAQVLILQEAAQGYRPELYVKAAPGADKQALQAALQSFVAGTASKQYPGLSVAAEGDLWRIVIPDQYRTGHEAHFGQVTDAFLKYLGGGPMPGWERSNMLAKYYVTTRALELCRQGQ